jgi:outer membrane protein assembly factor BamB
MSLPLVAGCLAATTGRRSQTVLQAAAGSDFWPVKNGDQNRTGASSFAVPSDLAVGPTWRWVADYPSDIVRAAPLIDKDLNIYIAAVMSGRVYKISPDGNELWRYSTLGTPTSDSILTDGIPEVPALMDGALYLTTTFGFAISLDGATGRERWRVSLGELVPGDTWSMSAAAGTVLAATMGGATSGERRLVALDARGRTLWQTQLDGAQASYNVLPSIVPLSHGGGGAVVLADAAGSVYKLSLRTGERIWSASAPEHATMSTGGAIVGPDDTMCVHS